MNQAAAILVVDDNPVSRLALVETLRDEGFAVEACDSGASCRRRLDDSLPNLILLDVNLPDANGMDLCREFKSDPRFDAVFIGLISTSQITPDQQAAGLNLGADAYITRPLPDHELLARVRALLRIQRAELALRHANEELERKVAERTADLARANATLREEVKERRAAEAAQQGLATRLGALHTLDQAILQATSPDEIAEASVACLSELLPADLVQVWQVDGEAERTRRLGRCWPETGQPDELGFTPEIRRTLEQLTETADLQRTAAINPFDPTDDRTWPRLLLFSVTAREQLLGVVVAAFQNTATLPGEWIAGGQEITGTLAIALSQARLFDEVLAGRRRMRQLSRRMLAVQEEERRFLSRELHDEIGQNLTGIKAMLETGIRESAPGAVPNLSKALGIVNELMGQVRRLSIDLRPQMLDELGLSKALVWQFSRLREQAGLEVDFLNNDPDGARLPETVEIALFRIAQEALTNVIRHAGEKRAQVRLWIEPDRCRLQIRDEGAGFDSREKLRAVRTAGLSGMIERAELLGGELLLESTAGEGTCLTVDLPLT